MHNYKLGLTDIHNHDNFYIGYFYIGYANLIKRSRG